MSRGFAIFVNYATDSDTLYTSNTSSIAVQVTAYNKFVRDKGTAYFVLDDGVHVIMHRKKMPSLTDFGRYDIMLSQKPIANYLIDALVKGDMTANDTLPYAEIYSIENWRVNGSQVDIKLGGRRYGGLGTLE